MSALSAAAQDEDGDTIKALRARIASLEALLCGEPGFYITLPRSVLEQALTALQMYGPSVAKFGLTFKHGQDAIEALRAALEQPQVEQEPVAWMFQHDETGRIMYVDAQQVEWGFEKGNPRWQKIYPVYLNPQTKREPLTDEQILGMGWFHPAEHQTFLRFARAIEAAHGIGGDA